MSRHIADLVWNVLARMSWQGRSAALEIFNRGRRGNHETTASGEFCAATEAGDSGAPGKGAGEAGLRTSPAMAMEGDSTAAAWVAEL